MTAIVSLLFGFAKDYWKPLVVIGAILGLFVYHRVTLAYAHHVGYEDAKKEMQVKLDKAEQDNADLQTVIATLRADVEDQNKRVDALMDQARTAQEASDKALADEQAKSKLWQGQASQYVAIINRPKATDGQVCSRADGILRDLISDSMRQ